MIDHEEPPLSVLDLFFLFDYVSTGCGIFDIIIARRWELAYSGV